MHPKRSDTSSSVGHQTPDTSLLVLQPLAAETLHHFHLVERCNGVSPQNRQGLWDFMHMRMCCSPTGQGPTGNSAQMRGSLCDLAFAMAL